MLITPQPKWNALLKSILYNTQHHVLEPVQLTIDDDKRNPLQLYHYSAASHSCSSSFFIHTHTRTRTHVNLAWPSAHYNTVPTLILFSLSHLSIYCTIYLVFQRRLVMAEESGRPSDIPHPTMLTGFMQHYITSPCEYPRLSLKNSWKQDASGTQTDWGTRKQGTNLRSRSETLLTATTLDYLHVL